jgi:hypothetical protein
MSDYLKDLPAGAGGFPSIQTFQQYCQQQAGGAENFNLGDAVVLNRDLEDGQFEVLYQEAAEDFFCAANINLNNHEMFVRAVTAESRELRGEAQLEMHDACSLGQFLVGETEKGVAQCNDAAVFPPLLKPKVQNTSSIRHFKNYCEQGLARRARELSWDGPVLPFHLKRTQVINADAVEPTYTLRYQSMGQDFVCEATVDPMAHLMVLRHGKYFEGFGQGGGEVLEMTDACSLTTNLLGAEKLLGECDDRTQTERNVESCLTLAFHTVVSTLAMVGLYKIGKGVLTKSWRFLGPVATPLLSAAKTYFNSPLSKLGWASRLGWAGVAFYGGWKAGRALDHLPELWGGREISSYGADALYSAFGPAPDWMVDATDWVLDIF